MGSTASTLHFHMGMHIQSVLHMHMVQLHPAQSHMIIGQINRSYCMQHLLLYDMHSITFVKALKVHQPTHLVFLWCVVAIILTFEAFFLKTQRCRSIQSYSKNKMSRLTKLLGNLANISYTQFEMLFSYDSFHDFNLP